MERWLSLTVSQPVSSEAGLRKARVLISVPKRTVKLAVTRNRLKRILREAIRRDPFFMDDKIYLLKVRRLPQTMDLHAVRRTLEALHD